MDDFEAESQWWIPDSPNRRVPGILSYSSEKGVEIRMFGTLTEPRFGGGATTYPRLYGLMNQSNGGKHATAVGAMQTSLSMSSPGMSMETIFVPELFVGDCFLEDHDTDFDSCKLTISGLREWLPQAEVEFAHGEKDGNTIQVDVKYKSPPTLTLDLADRVVKFQANANFTQQISGNFSLNHEAEVVIELPEHASLTEVWKRVGRPLQNLMTIASGHAALVNKMSVSSESIRALGDERGARQRAVQVLRPWSVDPKQTKANIHRHELLFSSDAFEADALRDFIRNWFELHTRMPQTCSRYFAHQYCPDPYLDSRLSALISTLAIFFREKGEIRDEWEVATQAAKALIHENLVADQLPVATDSLIDAFDIGLGDQIVQILTDADAVMQPLTGKSPQQFAAELLISVRSQQKLALRDDPRAMTGANMHRMVEQMQVLLKWLLLTEAGVDSTKVEEWFLHSQEYVWLRQSSGQS